MAEKLSAILKELRISADTYDITEYSSLAQLQGELVEPDILLLDIAFQNEDDGTQVAVQLRRRWSRMQLIFVTSLENCIQKAFDAYAVGYVVKKDLQTDLPPAVQRAVRRLSQLPPISPKLKFSYGLISRQISVEDILYVYMENRRLNLCLKGPTSYPNPLPYLGTIQKESARLEGYGFFRIDKSLIVNLNNVEHVQDEYLVMCNGEKIYFNKKLHSKIQILWENIKENNSWNMSSR